MKQYTQSRLGDITGEECGECGDEEREDDGWAGLCFGDLTSQHVQTSSKCTAHSCAPHNPHCHLDTALSRQGLHIYLTTSSRLRFLVSGLVLGFRVSVTRGMGFMVKIRVW